MKFFLLFLFSVSLIAQKPQLLLLENYDENINLNSWYMSEKLDGVRAYWDGKNLISRSGKKFSPPKYFIKDFPSSKLDGELWTKRDDFSNISSIVNSRLDDKGWRSITYNIFEVPHAKGNLLQRLSSVKETKYIKRIPQISIENKEHLQKFLDDVIAKSGEGVVARDGSLLYYSGRTKSAMKIKRYLDAECEVVGFTEAKGKFEGLVGSLLCKKDEIIFKIGSGLSNQERKNPPKIGTMIQFKYYGLTKNGIPRFPVYMRVREKE